jgi:hypothetical protein
VRNAASTVLVAAVAVMIGCAAILAVAGALSGVLFQRRTT